MYTCTYYVHVCIHIDLFCTCVGQDHQDLLYVCMCVCVCVCKNRLYSFSIVLSQAHGEDLLLLAKCQKRPRNRPI